jgi:DNA polymerase III sliding clamp (beta) subunit (PCNA family)
MEILNILILGVGLKENDLQQTCYVFKNGTVYAYDDEICMSGAAPVGMCDITFAVQAKEFHSLINKLRDAELDIELTENCLIVKSSRVKAEIVIESEIKMPIDEIQFPKSTLPLPDDFSKALNLVLPVVGKDMTKPLSTAVHLDGAHIEASDTDKCARYTLGSSVFDEPLYISKSSAALTAKTHPTHFAVSNGWIHFHFAEKYYLSCRTKYKGQPGSDLTELLESRGSVLTLSEEIPDALERAGLFVESKDGTEIIHEDKYVNIKIVDNWVYVSGRGAIGSYEEKIRTEYTGKKIHFAINVGLLLTAMREKQTCEICKNWIKIFDEKFCHIVAFGAVKEDN